MKAPADLVSDEDHFLTDGCFLTVISQSRRNYGALWSLFYKSTNSIHEGLTPSWSRYLTNAPPPNIIALGMRFQHEFFREEYKYMYIYIYTYMCIYTHLYYLYEYIYVYKYTCIYECIHTHTFPSHYKDLEAK